MTPEQKTETLEEIAERIAGFSLVAYHDNPDAVRAQVKADILAALRNERERCAKVAWSHPEIAKAIREGR